MSITLSLFLIIFIFLFLWCLFTMFFIFILFVVFSLLSFLNLTLIRILILFIITCPRSIGSSLVHIFFNWIWSLNLIDWCHVFRCNFSFFSINKLLLCLRSFWSINLCSYLSLAFGLYYSCLRSFLSFINLLRGLVLLLRSFLDIFGIFDFFSFFSFFRFFRLFSLFF